MRCYFGDVQTGNEPNFKVTGKLGHSRDLSRDQTWCTKWKFPPLIKHFAVPPKLTYDLLRYVFRSRAHILHISNYNKISDKSAKYCRFYLSLKYAK